MLYRKIGSTNEEVSILGFGCMRLPVIDGDNNKIDEEKAIKMIRAGIDNGVNYVDTAYAYHGGASEPLVGKALKDGYREKVYLATKLPSWLIYSREDMDSYLDEQLDKLQTDHIDFYLVHNINRTNWKRLKKCGIFEFLDSALKDGRIKYAGFSFHDEIKMFKDIVDSYNWAFCQIQYNYLDEEYQAGREGLMYAASKGLGVIVMEPLRGGKLASDMPEDIKAVWNKADIKRSPAEWGLRFVWDHPQVSLVLSGMSDMDQVVENIQSAESAHPDSLTDKEKGLINEVKDIYKSRMKVDCTNCRYCMPCPWGVNIPESFRHYNNIFMFDDLKEAKRKYGIFINKDEMASRCLSCGRCEKACPQHIEVSKMLKEVVNALEN